jgi:hypothetical protein
LFHVDSPINGHGAVPARRMGQLIRLALSKRNAQEANNPSPTKKDPAVSRPFVSGTGAHRLR